MCTTRLAVRRRQRRRSRYPPEGSPCSRSPSVRTIRSRPSGERRTTWNQPLGVGHVDERPVGGPAWPGVVAALAGDDLLRAGRDVDERDLRGRRGRPGGAARRWRSCVAVRRPGEAVDVDAGRRSGRRASGACGSRCGRPRRGTGASMSQTWVQPRRRDRKARRRPSGDQRGSRPPPGLATTQRLARPVGLDDPDLVVADEGEAPAVGRPLRIADRLLRRGDLGRRRPGPAQREREQLAGAGRSRPCRRRRGRAG